MVEFNVLKFVSTYKKANTFIIEINEFDVLIIDLGNYPVNELLSWLVMNNKNVLGLVLTHEHADHCYGVDKLKSKIDFPLYCSKKCEINMRNPKQNFSRYIEDFETFGVQSEAVIIKDKQVLNFGGFELKVMETPGHSPGSICLITDNVIFTGDTLLYNAVSPLNFPHSDKKKYLESKKKIMALLTNQHRIYPGHGEPYKLKS